VDLHQSTQVERASVNLAKVRVQLVLMVCLRSVSHVQMEPCSFSLAVSVLLSVQSVQIQIWPPNSALDANKVVTYVKRKTTQSV